jgi:cytochrome P450
MASLVQQYGDIFWLRGPGKGLYFVSNPAFIKHFMVDQGLTNYPKAPFSPGTLSGEALSTSSGEFWKRHRRMIQPTFHKERLLSQVPRMVGALQRVLDRRWEPYLRSGEPVDILREMSWAVVSTLGQLVYSEDPQDDICDAAWHFKRAAIRPRSRLRTLPIPIPRGVVRWLVTRRDPHAYTAAARFKDFASKTVRERMAQSEQQDDMLGMLINARDDNGERMTELEVRAEFIDLLYGGHVSTGLGLSWMWYLLDANPEIAARAATTVEQALGGRAPTAADLPALQYLNQVFSETLRLHPPAPGLMRTAIKDDTIGGYDVPAGTQVGMTCFVMHRLSQYWKNPEAFDPEHFSEEQVKARPRFVYLPFGAGQRVCIGAMLATTIATLFSALVLQRYRLELVPGTKVIPIKGGAHYPENLWMRVLPARGAGGREAAA